MDYRLSKRKGSCASSLLIAVWSAFVATACAVEEPVKTAAVPPARVLFVGNSFTYYNNSLHNHYRRLVAASEIHSENPSSARILTISGGYLPEHAAGLQQRLDDEDWDIVVLQGHSRGPISDETSQDFRNSARNYARLVREDGAEPVFFMTWAYSDQPEMTVQLDKAYSDIGEELQADVVPVGLAFAAVSKERPELELRIADARHPSLAGTYLAACTFFAVLHHLSPENLSYFAGLAADDAAYLQSVAWRVVTDYQARSGQ